MTKENSFVAQRMISSASRERSTAVIAVTKANSATKSRDAVPSMELATEPRSKPRSGRDRLRVEPEGRPRQRAGTVRGHGRPLVPLAAAARRPGTGAAGIGQDVVGEEHGLGVLEVRTAGHGHVRGAPRRAPPARPGARAIRPPMMRAWSRRYIRKSVATWSFRDRPARSLPPRSGPRRSRRPRSRAVWTSSSAMVPG